MLHPPANAGRPTPDPLRAALTAAGAWSPFTHITVSFASVAILAALDLLTGPQISLAVFFLLPIATLGWYTSRPWSVALATVAGFAWFLDFRPLLSQDMPTSVVVWTCCSRVGMCMTVAWLVGALREMFDQQRTLASTDDVTGLANRRALVQAVQRETARCARAKKPLSLIYLDADRFKSVNDRLGHAEGDRLLRTVASTLTEACRKTDTVARMGGDEFAVLLSETDGPGSTLVAEKLRARLHAAMSFNRWPVTFSMGVATFASPPADPEQLIRAADQLQYNAKHAGPDGIAIAAA